MTDPATLLAVAAFLLINVSAVLEVQSKADDGRPHREIDPDGV